MAKKATARVAERRSVSAGAEGEGELLAASGAWGAPASAFAQKISSGQHAHGGRGTRPGQTGCNANMTRVFRVSEAVRVEELWFLIWIAECLCCGFDTVWKISIAKNTVWISSFIGYGPDVAIS
ncbi:hypothetical protein ABE501_13995 [Comamonas testosteroni]